MKNIHEDKRFFFYEIFFYEHEGNEKHEGKFIKTRSNRYKNKRKGVCACYINNYKLA